MKSVDDLIGNDVSATLRADRRIRSTISRIVPAQVMPHLLFCRIADHCLHLTFDAAPWITRLRFIERQLLEELERSDFQVVRIRWHVSPPAPMSVPGSSVRTDIRPPSSAARAMKQLAEMEQSSRGDNATDEASIRLQRVMLQLADTLEKRSRRDAED